MTPSGSDLQILWFGATCWQPNLQHCRIACCARDGCREKGKDGQAARPTGKRQGRKKEEHDKKVTARVCMRHAAAQRADPANATSQGGRCIPCSCKLGDQRLPPYFCRLVTITKYNGENWNEDNTIKRRVKRRKKEGKKKKATFRTLITLESLQGEFQPSSCLAYMHRRRASQRPPPRIARSQSPRGR